MSSVPCYAIHTRAAITHRTTGGAMRTLQLQQKKHSTLSIATPHTHTLFRKTKRPRTFSGLFTNHVEIARRAGYSLHSFGSRLTSTIHMRCWLARTMRRNGKHTRAANGTRHTGTRSRSARQTLMTELDNSLGGLPKIGEPRGSAPDRT